MSNKITINILQVLYGDAITVRFYGQDKKYHNVFIDAGLPWTYARTLNEEIKKVLYSHEKIDLFVITHIDQDHIGAMAQFIDQYGDKNIVNMYWFNGGYYNIFLENNNKISYREGIKLADYLLKIEKVYKEPIISELYPIDLYGAKITVISPLSADLKKFLKNMKKEKIKTKNYKITASEPDWNKEICELIKNDFKEDDRLQNKVSITFIFEYNKKSILFLADSCPSTIINVLKRRGYSKKNKLKVDYVKISHHASKSNTNYEILEIVECNSFIISANGENRDYLPHKEALARILTNPERDFKKKVKFIFNYNNDVLKRIFKDSDYETYNFECLYPEEGEYGFKIEL